MPRGKRTQDLTTIQMALVGYQVERQKIDDKIRELQAILGGGKRTASAGAATTSEKAAAPAKKRTLSASARKRIALAQKKRWAEHRKKLAAAGKES